MTPVAPVAETEPLPPSRAAFRSFVEAYQRSVYALALDLTGQHADAEDLTQEVFVQAYRHGADFRAEAAVTTWLYRIAVNTYLNGRRAKVRRMRRLVGRFHEASLVSSPRQEAHAASADVRRHVERALGRLSPKERTAFVLRFQHEQSVAETAAAMGVADGTVKSLCYRAVRKLRAALDFYRDDLGLR